STTPTNTSTTVTNPPAAIGISTPRSGNRPSAPMPPSLHARSVGRHRSTIVIARSAAPPVIVSIALPSSTSVPVPTTEIVPPVIVAGAPFQVALAAAPLHPTARHAYVSAPSAKSAL